MKLKIVTPERIVFEGDVEAVFAKAVDGELGVLPKHVPMVTPLDSALLHYKANGETHYATVMEGILSTDGEVVTVLTDAAELSGNVDFARAEKARERAEQKLREQADDAVMKAALAREKVRLKLKK